MPRAAHTYTFRSPSGWGRWARILLAVSALWSVASAVYSYGWMRSHALVIVLTPGATPRPIRTSPLPQALSALGSLAGLAVIVVWLMWQYRVTANVSAQGRPIVTSPGWAVGWWFVPVANLWMPAVALYRVCRASLGRPDAEMAWLVVAWWLAYTVVELIIVGAAIAIVGSSVIQEIDAATRTGGNTVVLDLTSSMHALAPWTLVPSLMRVPAAALAIVLITRIDRVQELTGPPVPPRPDLGF